MRKIKLAALSGAMAMMVTAYTTPLMAFTVGVGGSLGGAHVEASGQEYMNVGLSNTVTAGHKMDKDAFLPLGAAHVEIIIGESHFGERNGFALGIQNVFGEGNINHVNESSTRTNLANLAVEDGPSGNTSAKVKLKNINTMYLETPGFTPLGIYLKAGYSEMDIVTDEDVYTGATYGDASVDGTVWGFGFKKAAESGLQFKIEFTDTDWDSVSLSNSDTDAGANKITATPQSRSASMSIGYVF